MFMFLLYGMKGFGLTFYIYFLEIEYFSIKGLALNLFQKNSINLPQEFLRSLG